MENEIYSCRADCTAQSPFQVVAVVVSYSMALGDCLYLRSVVLASVEMH